MKSLHTLLLAIIVAVMAVACDVAVERIPIMEYQKQMIPYPKGQKVCFTDAEGNTTLYTTTDVTTEWGYDWEALIKVWLQEYKVILQSKSGDLISLHVGSDPYSYDGYALNHSSYNEINLTLKGLAFLLPFDCAGKFYSRDGICRVYDSLSINDRIYYDVVEENHKNGQLYYNKIYGILQLKQNGKDILTLQQ